MKYNTTRRATQLLQFGTRRARLFCLTGRIKPAGLGLPIPVINQRPISQLQNPQHFGTYWLLMVVRQLAF